MRDLIYLAEINDRLKNNYGTVFSGEPKFRIIVADNTQLETKKATFEDRLPNGDLIRRVTEVRSVPKYESWEGYYILERYNEGPIPSDIFNYNGYDCLYIFKKKDGSPQDELAWFPIEFLVTGIVTAMGKPPAKQKTFKDYAQEYIDATDKEKQLFFEILDNESPYLATMLDNKEAVVVPTLPETPFKD